MSHVAFKHGALYYRVTDVLVHQPGVHLPVLGSREATAVLRSALASPTSVLAAQIRGEFTAIDGGRAGAPKLQRDGLADRIGTLVGQKRLTMVYYEPVSLLVNRVDEVPKTAPKAEPSVAARVNRVVAGLARVPPGVVGKQFERSLTELKTQLTSSPALVILLGAVLAAWVASHAAPPVGFVIDAALLGFAIASLGMLAFDWAGRLGKLVFAIGDAETDADFDACSAELARLIVEIGISTFMTLLLRAAGKKIGKSMTKTEPELRTGPAQPAGPVTRSATRGTSDPPAKPKPAPKKLPPNKDPRYKRGKFRKGVRDKVWESAKDKDGKVLDPLTGKEIKKNDPWEMGHKPKYEHRKHQKSASERNISRKDFLDEFNDPSHYRPELKSSNAGHKGEDMTDDYLGD